jgi:hypothetical protein
VVSRLTTRIPGEEAIAREMQETGFDRLPAIRRLQQLAAILREREQRRAVR